MSYCIGSGWWCDENNRRMHKEGADFTRSVDMFDLWYKLVQKHTNPSAIVVVDSNSPTKPDGSDDITWIEMQDNFYPPYHTSDPIFGLQRPAASRQIFLGATYAYFNEIDHYVWVEQDCVIKGDGIVERAIDNMRDAWFSLGEWDHRLSKCTSFIVIDTDRVFDLIDCYKHESGKPELRWDELSKRLPFWPLPFGYGRNRPMNYNDEHLYAQHTTEEELDDILCGT